MTAWIWKPDQNFERQIKTNVKVTQFGDGYEQRLGQGINTVKEQVSMSFSWREVSEINDMDEFLKTLGGVGSFTWTDPAGVTRKYTCREWNAIYHNGIYGTLTSTWIQVFEA